jgi:hypothetical protein
MPNIKLTIGDVIKEGTRKSYVRNQDRLVAKKITGYGLTRKLISDRQGRELVGNLKKAGVFKMTSRSAWKIWHDAQKKALEAKMKQEGGKEKMTTAEMREKMKETAERNVAADRALRQARGEEIKEDKKPAWGIERDVKTSALTRKDVSVAANQPRAKVSALESPGSPSPSSQSVHGKKEPEARPAIELQI